MIVILLGKKTEMKNREKTPWLIKCIIIATGLLIEITKSFLIEAMTKTLVSRKKIKLVYKIICRFWSQSVCGLSNYFLFLPEANHWKNINWIIDELQEKRRKKTCLFELHIEHLVVGMGHGVLFEWRM